MARRVPRSGPDPERPEQPGYDQGQYRQDQHSQGQYGRGQQPQGQYGRDQYQQGQYGRGQQPQGQYDRDQYQHGQYGRGQQPQGQYDRGQQRQGQYNGAQQPQGQYNGGQQPQGQYNGGQQSQDQHGQWQYAQGQYGQPGTGYEATQTVRQQGGPRRPQEAPGGNGSQPYQPGPDNQGPGNQGPNGYGGQPGGYGGATGGYGGPPGQDWQQDQAPGRGPGEPAPNGRPARDGGPRRKVRFRRTRRFFRRPTVRVISVLVALGLVWVMFSAGQAALKNNGQGATANLAEWARDHGLGPVVTFGEWLSYNPPPKGGKPSFSLAVPSGEAVTPTKPAKGAKQGFVPDIPATLKSLAPSPQSGEGQWRVAETVNGNPAILTTFLRDATYVSQVNGIASIDQRLVKFSLRPGSEDPGPAKWGVSDYIPASQRKGLLATFNGGFKLDSAGGGFYLNGLYHGTLVKGTASIVYYKNGTI
ncbi:MAG TPA: hypothetical protein VHV09_16035, partial [Trebonia sp.]|nr:hypothetical protein [Trebonia sp.]